MRYYIHTRNGIHKIIVHPENTKAQLEFPLKPCIQFKKLRR